MKLIEYKKERRDQKLISLGQPDMSKTKTNHAYEGNLRLLRKLDSGTHILFLKKKDIEDFKHGKSELFVFYEKMHENYSKTYSLAHMISSHANGLLIDEIKNILLHYHPEKYVIMPVVNYGQHFEYTSFVEGKDFTQIQSEENGIPFTHLTFFDEDAKEEFEAELDDLISIQDVLYEINDLTASEDVLFVHHEKGVGYATRNMELLEQMAGFIYQNYLITD